jgi:hypothetical protein
LVKFLVCHECPLNGHMSSTNTIGFSYLYCVDSIFSFGTRQQWKFDIVKFGLLYIGKNKMLILQFSHCLFIKNVLLNSSHTSVVLTSEAQCRMNMLDLMVSEAFIYLPNVFLNPNLTVDPILSLMLRWLDGYVNK